MKTRLAALAAALCTATLAATPIAQAASATTTSAGDPATAKWEGRFYVASTLTRNDFAPDSVGQGVERTDVVRSSCAGRSQCPSITIARRSADGEKRTTTLRVTGDGSYQGTVSYPSSWSCGDPADPLYSWTGRTKETLAVEAEAAGGRKVIVYTGTTDIVFPAFRQTDDVPEECLQDIETRYGWRDGYRPRQQYTLRANRTS